jgi:NADH-quinone oxidoreductase subunit C
MTDEEKKEEPQPDKPEGTPSDAEKKAAAAPKPAAPTAKPAPPKPPAKAAPPKPEPLDNELLRTLRGRFGEAIGEASIDRGQAIVIVAANVLPEVGAYLRDAEKFNLLEDLTAVDWYDRRPRFDVILNLYSVAKNERVRLKAQVDDTCPSVASIWSTANWLERECFDMFGLRFAGHPDLRRILLPDEWKGHPLRKDYDILKQDVDWVRENLGIESGQ